MIQHSHSDYTGILYNTINFQATQQVLCRRESIGRCSYAIVAHAQHTKYGNYMLYTQCHPSEGQSRNSSYIHKACYINQQMAKWENP